MKLVLSIKERVMLQTALSFYLSDLHEFITVARTSNNFEEGEEKRADDEYETLNGIYKKLENFSNKTGDQLIATSEKGVL